MAEQNEQPGDTTIEKLLKEIIELSRHYGGDPQYVFGGGGNTSVKTDTRLYVKASGASLAEIDADGFVELDRAALAELLEADLPAEPMQREQAFKDRTLAARVHPDRGRRPSVESLLHHLLPGRLVVHTHPIAVNMLTCCVQGRELAERFFGNDVLWVPCTDPGYTLARELGEALRQYTEKTGREAPEAVLVENHGLFVAGQTPEEIHQRTARITDGIGEHLGEVELAEAFGPIEQHDPERARELILTIAPALRGLLAEDGPPLPVVRFDDSAAAVALAAGREGEQAATAGPITPDHMVYCATRPMWFEPLEEESPDQVFQRLQIAVDLYRDEHGRLPKVVLVRGLGMFSAAAQARQAELVREAYTNAIVVMAGAKQLGGVKYMDAPRVQFIENWEAEHYRANVSAGAGGAGRAAGKVALVTGAAQGFGREIADDLAEQGAHVVLADINAAGAAAAAAELCDRCGGPLAVGLAIDVADPAAVAEAVYRSVRAFGGLDLLVSNAGVLKAGSVKELPLKDFDFVTRVNYTGYFVCVQQVAPIMATQHRACPAAWADIVQINSKSGLEGSNRNGAYAGSKFGGLGLTQSFAKELVTDGIKVNSICPGNFFDGPLWSDPDNGLFVQYLRTHKVPGAKTLEDVRRAYEEKVPMNRGCTTADVMKAVYYLMEQLYETGQALPVTGGQVMLN